MVRQWLLALGLLAAGGAAGWTVARSVPRQEDKPAPPPAVAAPPKEPAAPVAERETPLDALDWLVGDWVAVGEESTTEFSCHFTKNKAFLLRSFRTFKKDGMGLSGMQVIAWDPAQESIRSWTYDSDGGFGEDTWSQSGDRYTIRAKYTLPDGGTGSAMHLLTYVNDDACTWQSVNREIDGEFQPDSAQIVVVRAADDEPDAEAKPSTTKPEGK
jgi:hypothetical protein